MTDVPCPKTGRASHKLLLTKTRDSVSLRRLPRKGQLGDWNRTLFSFQRSAEAATSLLRTHRSTSATKTRPAIAERQLELEQHGECNWSVGLGSPTQPRGLRRAAEFTRRLDMGQGSHGHLGAGKCFFSQGLRGPVPLARAREAGASADDLELRVPPLPDLQEIGARAELTACLRHASRARTSPSGG